MCSYQVHFQIFFFHFFFFPDPIYHLRPSCSLSLLVVTQIRGHIAGSSPLLPTTVRALHSCREKISAISSLVDSRRMLTHAINRRSQQLILVLFCCFFANEFKISPRRDSNSRTNTIDSSIRGLPLVHRGDRLRSLQVTIKTNLFGRASAPSTELNI